MYSVVYIILFLFIIYYMFTLYVFNELNKNPCMCKKLEGFKKSWNFKYVMIASPLLLLVNFFIAYKLLWFNQKEVLH